MSTLAHVLEAAGLATVVLTPMRFIAEKMATPRALHVDFPLGWPVGQPRDAEFQHRVLSAAFALLEQPSGPVLADFPERIDRESETALLPASSRFDPDLPPAVDESRALADAYRRAVAKNGRTSVGRVIDADRIPDVLDSLARVADGESWGDQGLDATPMMLVHDIRAYYEELAFELADGPITPYGAERWFYDETEAGKTVMAARRSMRDAGESQADWFYMAPASRR